MMSSWQALFFVSLLLEMMILFFKSHDHNHHFLSFYFFLAASLWSAFVTLTFLYCRSTRFPLPVEPGQNQLQFPNSGFLNSLTIKTQLPYFV